MKKMLLLMVLMSSVAWADSVVPITEIGKEIVSVSQSIQGMAGEFVKSEIGVVTAQALWIKFVFLPLFRIFGGLFLSLLMLVFVYLRCRKVERDPEASEQHKNDAFCGCLILSGLIIFGGGVVIFGG